MRGLLIAAVCVISAVAAARPMVVGVSDNMVRPLDEAISFYVDALATAGHVPMVIGGTVDKDAIAEAVSRIDCLLLTGGEDVDPSRYGAAPDPNLGKVNVPRDEFDFALLDAAVARRIPVFGVCRGLQLMNVYFGGTLWQDLPTGSPAIGGVRCTHRGGKFTRDVAATNAPAHTVSIVEDSRMRSIVGTDVLRVNSHHHQAVCRTAPGFRVAARAPDGVIEAIEGDVYPAAGVQFHPEKSVACVARHPAFDRNKLLSILRHLRELTGATKWCDQRK